MFLDGSPLLAKGTTSWRTSRAQRAAHQFQGASHVLGMPHSRQEAHVCSHLLSGMRAWWDTSPQPERAAHPLPAPSSWGSTPPCQTPQNWLGFAFPQPFPLPSCSRSPNNILPPLHRGQSHRPTNPNASRMAQKVGGSDGCPRCGQAVYAAEKVIGAGKVRNGMERRGGHT